MISSEYLDWLRQQIANANEHAYEYIISRSKNNKQYFYYDFDYIGAMKGNLNYQLLWTPTQKQAFPFMTEEEVEEFKAHYVSPRKASIIRVIRTPSMIEYLG